MKEVDELTSYKELRDMELEEAAMKEIQKIKKVRRFNAMIIKFISLNLHNYKAHRDLEVKFGDLTKITGDNAKGKSSILEAIPFVFYGTDALGSKTDPSPTNYEFDYVKAELLVSIDGKQTLFARGIERNKAVYYINDVPSKATEFDELVRSLSDKDLFLSLLNPSHFFTLHWETQRAMLLRYVTAPANKEVFKQLPETQADKLAELVKKHSIEDLEKIHRENKTKQDKAYIAAQSRTKTLQEQLERLGNQSIDIEKTKAESAALLEQIKAIEKITDSADETNRKRSSLQATIDALKNQIHAAKERYMAEYNESINDTCPSCKRPLDDDALKAVIEEKEKRKERLRAEHTALIEKRKQLVDELDTIEYIDVSEQLQEIREIEHKRDALEDSIYEERNREELYSQVEQARKDEAATLASRNESVFILDAIKAFSAKEAELQADKVQSLFTTLSLRLFKEDKGDGEIKPDFEIMMDGKPYRKLSLSEGIRAGLELRDVLSEQSGVVAPCFVDNAESITRFLQPNGQLITSRVVAGQELKIETEEQQ